MTKFRVVIVSALLAAAFFAANASAGLKKLESGNPAAGKAGSSSAAVTCSTEKGVEFACENPSAKSVAVAGSFNDWNASRDVMSKDKSGVWRVTLPLKAGSHQYKFVVDGNWMPDPGNPKTMDDGFGGKNSVVEVKAAPSLSRASSGPAETKDGVKFVYKNPSAKSVAVAGSFNNWNAQADTLSKQKDGTWLLIKKLPKGRHHYKFVVDGNWSEDPANPNFADDGYGGKNSVAEVGGDVSVHAAPPAAAPSSVGTRQTKAGVEFALDAPSARSVAVAGTFNNWNTSAHRLEKDKSGSWKISVPLKPGAHQYKFVVDGEWRTDPSNKTLADDGYGGKNSVVEVK